MFSPLTLPDIGPLLTHEVSAFHTTQEMIASPSGFTIKILILFKVWDHGSVDATQNLQKTQIEVM